MQVVIAGGGPAGLYLAVLLRKLDPWGEVVVFERDGPHDAYGWGVVFSEQTLTNLYAADPTTFDHVAQHFQRWDDIDIHVRGRTMRSGGHGFVGVARRTLLSVLAERADALGADVRYHQELRDPADLPALGMGGADLVVGADGVRSAIRAKYAQHFRPSVDERPARYLWLGTTRHFDAFTFAFAENEHGVFQAHAYPFDERHSAFIVECDPASWRNAGFDRIDVDASVRACEALFAPWLDGHPLLANVAPRQRARPWQQFLWVTNERWYHDRVVLLGDAAHTAHYSIGSGTKLAMEDAIGLTRVLSEGGGSPDEATLAAYEAERRTEALRLQNAARNSMEWFENVRRYTHLPPEQFAYSLLTRSQRVSHENLRLRDAEYLQGVESWFEGAARGPTPGTRDWGGKWNGHAQAPEPRAPRPRPPMFTPFRLRDLTLANRVVVSPMDVYSAEDGTPNDFHLVHLGARALGGAGLLMTEMACVSPDARISLGCAGMYKPEHVAAWRRVTEMAHRWTGAKVCLQLGHSGAKGATKLMWEGNEEPLEEGAWELVAPSAVAYRPGAQVPRAMTRDDMDRVRDDFVRAARMAVEADFDMLELHCAHGYLLSAFITPLANRRGDEYGGALENRLRFPLEVFAATRAAWPAERPMSVRISATDWVAGGVDGGEAVTIARAFRGAGVDIVHVSAGQTSPDARPVYGRMFQTPFSDRVRNEAGVPTIAVGNITDADQVNAIIAAGRADLCALGRPHLTNPHWTLHAAAELGYAGQPWPPQYDSGRRQLERELQRRVEMLEAAGA